MRLHAVGDAGSYAAALHDNPDDIDRLAADLLIDAPVFFRDAPAIDELARALQALRARSGEHERPLRVWVPGCGTGEEAYSIAMALSEQMDLAHPGGTFEIVATDADPRAVEIARAGRYPASVSMYLTPARLERFLEHDHHCYTIVPSLHRRVTFAVHDLRNDPPLANIDLVSCRSLLTRLEPDARQEVLSLFHVALRPGGHLFVGRGEGIGPQGPLFVPAAEHRQLWQRRDPVPRLGDADRDLLTHAENSRRPMDRYVTHATGPLLAARFDGAALLGAKTTGVFELWDLIRRVEGELRSSHDELKSARQTIASLKEQLKSSKEELRLVSPDVVTVLLDKDVRVRRFTAAASRTLNVTDSDVGRGIEEVATTLVDVDLGRHAREVLRTGTSVEQIVTVQDGRQFTLRLLACRRDHREVPLGVLVALVDVSSMTARERHFRLAYDALQHSNDTLERRVTERTKWLGLLHLVTRAIGDAPSWDEGLRLALHHICEHEGWQLGYVYLTDPDAPDVVVHSISCVRDDAVLPFHQASEHRRYSSGLCLPGRVYADGSPAWFTTQQELIDSLPTRGAVAKAVGLKTAVALPVRFGGRAIAVLELFSTEVHRPSDTLLDLMHDVSDQIGHVVERERRNVQMEARIWREQQDLLHTLHDSLGQTLTGLGLMASALRKRLGASDAAIADTSRQIALHAESALGEIRQLAKGLFPTDLDADGLLSALRQLATTTQAMHPVKVEVQDGSAVALRDHRIATNLYRIAQEAVTNSVKHADARTITIRIQTNSGLTTLRVSDDGRGIDDAATDADGVGLRIMNYRARSIGATLTVASQAHGGTMVTCAVREALHSVRTPGHVS
jgi:signal transduction histidine kinase/chemotaxis methyl-accepting protein methylase